MKKSVWILTREHNEYDQYGEYFCCVFGNRPTESDLLDYFKDVKDQPAELWYALKYGETEQSKAVLEYIISGGGRRGTEDVWWHLTPIPLRN